MRISFLVLTLSVLAACTTVPDADGSSYRDKQTATGSNIPRRGSAATVDKDSVQDSINRTSGVSLRNGS